MANPTSGDIFVNGHKIEFESQKPGPLHGKYVILKCKEEIFNRHLFELKSIGVVIDELISLNGCICYSQAPNLSAIRALTFVASVIMFPQSLIIRPSLQSLIDGSSSVSIATDASSKDPAAVLSKDMFAVSVTLHQRSWDKAKQIHDRIIQNLSIPEDRKDSIQVYGPTISASLTANEIGAITIYDEVKCIEERREKVPSNDVAGPIVRPPPEAIHSIPMYPSQASDWELSGYRGKGQIIAVGDSGLDTGKEFGGLLHPAFRGRIKDQVSVGRAAYRKSYLEARSNLNQLDATDDPYGHGTHIAATIVGSYWGKVPNPTSTGEVGRLIEGGAPDAKLVFHSMGSWGPNFKAEGPLDVFSAFDDKLDIPYKEAYEDHSARIYSYSGDWRNLHAGIQEKYSTPARLIDATVSKYSDYVISKAAMNEGNLYSNKFLESNISQGAASRNGITVGACYSARKAGIDDNYNPTGDPTNPNDIPTLSSRGFTMENVIKPDIVAPGVAINSALSQHPKAQERSKSKDRSSDRFSIFKTGTSMAAPLVAAAAACIRQALIERGNIESPSAALVKAIMINTATDLSKLKGRLHDAFGRYLPPAPPPKDLQPVPGTEQGWGRLDLTKALTTAVSGGQDPTCGYWGSEVVSLPDLPGDYLQNKLLLSVKQGDKEIKSDAEPNITRSTNVKHVKFEEISTGSATITVSGLLLREQWAEDQSLGTSQAYAIAWRLISAKRLFS